MKKIYSSTGTKKIYSQIKFNNKFKQTHIFLVIICMLFIPFNFLHSQAFEFDTINSTVEIEGFETVNNKICPFGPPPPKAYLIQNFTRGGWGHDFLVLRGRGLGHRCWDFFVSAWICGEVSIDGDNTGLMEIRWLNHAHVKAYSEGLFNALAEASEDFTLYVVIKGKPIGAPVTCYFKWRHFGAGLTEHEFNLEDPVFSDSYFSLNGNFQWNLGGPFYFADPPPPGITGWNRLEKESSFQALIGDTITLVLSSYVYDTITNDHPWPPYYMRDKASADQHGWIKLSLTPIIDPPVILNQYMSLYSLDIGSDREFSDSKNVGNEVFDPGDMYKWPNYYPNPNLVFDDSLIFGIDPKPYSEFTGAPTCSGLPVDSLINLYFDLDGFDALNVSLSDGSINYGPGYPSVPFFNTNCIHKSEYLWISYDDDAADHYVDSIPTSSFSPILGHTYGTFREKDELVCVHVSPHFPSPCAPFPYAHETFIDSAMWPNPDTIIQLLDDDVDAIDIMCDSCFYYYFSADHEASYDLNPGSIYEYSPSITPSYIEVVNANTHMSLIDGTDINAFEFVWLYDTLENRYGMTLLFSVDDDDPLTPLEDESGGLDPSMIYGSFLNGQYFEYLLGSLDEDIDAITAYYTTPIIDTFVSINENSSLQEHSNIIYNYPNPFSDYTNIVYHVLESNYVELSIYDMHGRKISTLVDEYMIKGVHNYRFNASGLKPGVYVCNLRYGYVNAFKKILFVK